MDNTHPPEQECASPEATNASTRTTDEGTHETDFETPFEGFDNISELQLNEDAPISTWDTSADTNEAISASQHEYDNIFCSVNSQDFPFYSALQSPKGFEVSGESRNNPVSYDSVLVSSDHTRNRKRSVSNDRMTSKNNPDHKISKPEICGTSSKDVLTGSQQDMINYDTLELNATSQVAFENDALAGNIEKNIESNNNISEIVQSDNATSKILDSIASGRESIASLDDSLPDAAGPSGLCIIKNTSKMRTQANQSFTCRVCKKEISQHASEENTFKCCECSFTCREEVDLQIHSYSHVSIATCVICKKKHAAGNSHNRKHACPVCPITFQYQCRTIFYEHLLDHKDYFKNYCWVCSRSIPKHRNEKKNFYCCVCGFESKHKASLVSHNVLHFPRILCRICEEEYSTEEKVFHGSEFTCFECPIKFECKTQVEQHYIDLHKNYSDTCKICKRSITDHFIGSEGIEFQCCDNGCSNNCRSENTLQDHLYLHTDLRVFKCDTCGRRFNLNDCLRGHSSSCKELSFKCEKCEKRFHTSDILRAHHLLTHSKHET